ncbi:MAG: family 10 glycosylhydrolase [Limnochordia bacterium]|jgi:uncharacterized lipoprotein YddW (UPF0748 family)
MKPLIVCLILLLVSLPVGAGEGRALWLNVGDYPPDAQGMEELFATLAEANFNMVFPQVFYHGQTVYPSSWAASYGIRTQNPRFAHWDPLGVLVELGAKYGIEIHPWLDVLYVGYREPGAILDVYPHWAMEGFDGQRGHGPANSSRFWLSPVEPQARGYLIGLIEELVTRYPVDGIHLDYIRYPDPQVMDFGYEERALEAFGDLTGVRERPHPDHVEHYSLWNRWRGEQITSLVEEIAGVLPENVALSAAVSPGGIPYRAYPGLLQPWADWVDYLDFLVPMAYSSRLKEVAGMIRYTRYKAGELAIMAGLQLWKLPQPNYPVEQVEIARAAGAQGVALFALPYLNSQILRDLAEGPFATPMKPLYGQGGEAVDISEAPQLVLPVGQPIYLEEFTSITGEEWSEPVTMVLVQDGEFLSIEFRIDVPVTNATITHRDGPVFYDDVVEVFFDPSGDTGLYYHLALNPLGTQYDAHSFMGPRWDGPWQAEAELTDSGWRGVIRIPLDLVGEGSESWSFNIGVGIGDRFASWSPMPGIFHAPENFGRLIFSR